MEAEELKSKVEDVLGGTQLTLSERTINEELEDALEDITDDAQVDDKFVSRLVKRLKRMDGNLHADVGAENKKYKEQFEADWNKNHPETSGKKNEEDGNDEPEWFKKYREAQDAKMKELEEARKESDLKAYKEGVLKEVSEGLDELFKKADITPNGYVLKQTMRDIEIPEKDADVEKLVKKIEKSYYKALKEAGLDGGGKPNQKNGPQGNSKMSDDLWNKKGLREGWKKKD
jgi:hypothetical protein